MFTDPTLMKIKILELKEKNPDLKYYVSLIQHPFRIKNNTVEFFAQTIKDDPLIEEEGFKECIQINVFVPIENEMITIPELFMYQGVSYDRIGVEVKKTDKLPVTICSTYSFDDVTKKNLKEHLLSEDFKYHLLPAVYIDKKTQKMYAILNELEESQIGKNETIGILGNPTKPFENTYLTYDLW